MILLKCKLDQIMPLLKLLMAPIFLRVKLRSLKQFTRLYRILLPVTLFAHSALTTWASLLFLKYARQLLPQDICIVFSLCLKYSSLRCLHGHSSLCLSLCVNITFCSRCCHALTVVPCAIPANGIPLKASATFYIKAFSTIGT